MVSERRGHMHFCMPTCLYACLGVREALNIYVCKVGCLLWDRGVAEPRRRRVEQRKMEGKERVPQACPGSDGSPDNLLCNGLPRSLTAVKLQAGATAEDSEETNGLLIQSAER